MAQEHIVGRDIALVGNVGCGKSELVRRFSRLTGYRVETMSLYKDMTARDLLQTRSTNTEGTTTWVDSPLLRAAKNGSIAVLDGIHRLHGETLTVVERLMTDRQLDLFDGTRMFPPGFASDGVSENCGAFEVHPSFRVVCLSIPPNNKTKWLTDEILSMVSFHHLPSLTPDEHRLLAKTCFQSAPEEAVEVVCTFAERLLEDAPQGPGRVYGGKNQKSITHADARVADTVAASLGVRPLSTRQIARIFRRMDAFPDSASQEVRGRLKAALMADFLAPSQREIVEKLLDEAGAGTSSNEQRAESVGIDVATRGDVRVLTIGDVVYEASAYPEKPELVPSPVFFDIPAHTQVLRGMLADVVAGEKNLLLIGNQGVGKNKLADRLLEPWVPKENICNCTATPQLVALCCPLDLRTVSLFGQTPR